MTRPATAPALAAQGDYRPEVFSRFLQFEDANRFWFRQRERLVGWALDRYFPTAHSFLELGCGTGSMLAYLDRSHPHLEMAGVDAFPEGLEIAAARVPGVPLFQADARRLPFESEFDVVASLDVIEHIEEDDQVLRQIHSALDKSGGLMITVPQHPWLWSGFDDFACHKRRYTRSELLGKVRAAGFEVLRVTSFVTLPLPAMALARLRQRRAGPDFDPVQAGSSPPPLSRLLDPLLGAEAAAIRRGWSPRLGGSLLLIARKA